MRTAVILSLIFAFGWTGWRLADVERQRYPLLTGICEIEHADSHSIYCLQSAEPRTSRLWDLYYGLID
jgi:hypothetical protein